MSSIVPRGFRYIETQKILTFQILFDGLENWLEISLARIQRRFAFAEEKILAAGFLREVAKTFAGSAHSKPSVTRCEEW
jgi:hypothetical protein